MKDGTKRSLREANWLGDQEWDLLLQSASLVRGLRWREMGARTEPQGTSIVLHLESRGNGV